MEWEAEVVVVGSCPVVNKEGRLFSCKPFNFPFIFFVLEQNFLSTTFNLTYKFFSFFFFAFSDTPNCTNRTKSWFVSFARSDPTHLTNFDWTFSRNVHIRMGVSFF